MADIHEECGVFGVYGTTAQDISALCYYGLYALQHRGQESCGIVVNNDGVFASHKDLGLVSEVFPKEILQQFPLGTAGVGHVRYGTTGGTSRANCQPVEINHQKGKMALAHNGNLSNAYMLRERLELSGAIFHTTSDTEIIAYYITRERLNTSSIETAVCRAMEYFEGAYSLVLMSATKLIAVRDPMGFRPLCFGQRPDGTYIVASESCALKAVGAEYIRDVEPGEILVFTQEGIRSDRTYCNTAQKKLCVFEYIYFSRPDSMVDGVSVHASRMEAGRILAKIHPVKADVVIGVPDSGLDAALGYAETSGIPYSIGLIKNKYIGRTFISPGQDQRIDQVKIKLSPVADVVRNQRVVLVDDSVVRGNTCVQLIKLLREAGAREIHMRISAPPFISPCYYGTDIDSKEHLIACHHAVPEMAEIFGADSLGFLPLDSLSEIACSDGICKACFGGEYPTGIPERTEKGRFEKPLSYGKKT